MPKVVVTNKKGLVQETGRGVHLQDGPVALGNELHPCTADSIINPAVPVTLLRGEINNGAVTLPDGQYIGQVKKLIYVSESDAGVDEAVVTVTTTLGAATTLTFTTVGETADLIWTGSTGWALLGRGTFVDAGVAAVAGLPQITTP